MNIDAGREHILSKGCMLAAEYFMSIKKSSILKEAGTMISGIV